MKKIVYVLIFLLLALPAVSATDPNDGADVKGEVQPYTKEEVMAIEARIMEIKEMDKSELTRDEKKALRKELRDMRKDIRERDEHRHRSGGLFISTGAIIIILLLIIIL